MENYLKYTEFILAIGLALSMLIVIVLCGVMICADLLARRSFIKSAKRSLNFPGIVESMKGITNDYEVYRNRWGGLVRRTIVELCQELEQKIKSQDVEEDIVMKLEEIISLYKDDYRFDDDKMNSVIENIRKQSSDEDARNVREYLIKVNAYHRGIVFEKERQINDAQLKMNRRKWWNRFCTLLGVIGSIASIYSIVK